MNTIAVFTTIDSLEQAHVIASSLVERNLAACVQISTIESFYKWQGAIQNEQEYRMLCKTTSERYADVESAIRELHTYDLPAIYSLDMVRAYEPFAEWVIEKSSGGEK